MHASPTRSRKVFSYFKWNGSAQNPGLRAAQIFAYMFKAWYSSYALFWHFYPKICTSLFKTTNLFRMLFCFFYKIQLTFQIRAKEKIKVFPIFFLIPAPSRGSNPAEPYLSPLGLI